MGMFDEIFVLSDPKKKYYCPAGHWISCYQTKSFENALDYYFLYKRRFYRKELLPIDCPRPSMALEKISDIIDSGGSEVSRWNWSGKLRMYTGCFRCKPRLYVNSTGFILDKQPWVEFSLSVDSGLVKRATRRPDYSLKYFERDKSWELLAAQDRRSISWYQENFSENWL